MKYLTVSIVEPQRIFKKLRDLLGSRQYFIHTNGKTSGDTVFQDLTLFSASSFPRSERTLFIKSSPRPSYLCPYFFLLDLVPRYRTKVSKRKGETKRKTADLSRERIPLRSRGGVTPRIIIQIIQKEAEFI